MESKKSVPKTTVAELLNKIYYDAKHPASFGGVEKLSKYSGVSKKAVKQWLITQDTYTLHKPVKFKFRRRPVIAFGIGELLQADLVDMSKFAKYNNGIKFLLTILDVFSRYAYVFPLKNKSAKSVVEAFKELLKQTKTIINIQTDEGGEFYNNLVKYLFKKMKINHYSSHSEHKASIVERFNRTLKNKLYRIFTYRNSYKYIDVLQDVVKSYNKSIHRTIGYAPSEVTPELESELFQRLYGFQPSTNLKFNIDDQVRISKAKKTFRRGYLPNWTDEVFVVYKRYFSSPASYVLKDLKGTVISGRFYEQELQKIAKQQSDYWRVEKILKNRGTGAKKEYFVKWKGFDTRFNSWVKASWMK